MKILLINPNFRDLIAGVEKFFTTPFTLPLGLAYLAGYLESHGYEVRVIDAHVENLTISQIIKRVKYCKPEVVGFSAHSSAGHCAILAQEIKRIYPDIITVIGGVVASLLPKETLESYPSIDFLIQGEGEIAFLKFVKTLEHGGALSDVPGLGYRKPGSVIINVAQEVIPDLDSLPLPARHLFSNRLYKYWPRLPSNVETLIAASRGCAAGNCDFCCIGKIFGTQVRKRDPEKVGDEIEVCLSEYNISNFSFIDSTFTQDKEFVYKITGMIKKRNLHKKIKWWCSTRVDYIDEELLKEMKSSGCVAISYGVEFGSQETLDFFNKKINLKDTERAFYLTKKADIWTTAYVIVNQYSSNFWDIIKDTYDFLLKIRPDLLRVSPLIVTPGTRLYHFLEKQGSFENTNYQPCLEGRYIESRYIKQEHMDRIKRNLYLSYYLKSNLMFSLLKGLMR